MLNPPKSFSTGTTYKFSQDAKRPNRIAIETDNNMEDELKWMTSTIRAFTRLIPIATKY